MRWRAVDQQFLPLVGQLADMAPGAIEADLFQADMAPIARPTRRQANRQPVRIPAAYAVWDKAEALHVFQERLTCLGAD
jgi:hypothetical protein